MGIEHIFKKKGSVWTAAEIQCVFKWLVDEELNKLIRNAYGITRNLELAEDAVQDGFLNAFCGLDTYDPSRYRGRLNRPFQNWIGIIVVNAALKLKRKKLEYLDSLNDRNFYIDTRINWEEKFAQEMIWQSVEKLKPRYYEALILYYRGVVQN
ncbi:sigma-70 family RNA polymerase sigma factor [Chloroflexi bacterium TSY]|nr:sigma-70 family RNA polymerase sigma factor [Chloroflexi bacterium TSY]